MAARLHAVYDAGLLTLIDGPTDVTTGVAMLPAPGESPGHAVVRIASGNEVFYHLGDLVHHWFEIDHPSWVIDEGSNHRDLTVLRESRQMLFRQIADEGAIVTFSHAAFPGWGRIVADASGYNWQRLTS